MLTSPVIAILSASGYEVHYLTKKIFADLISSNPMVDKLWILDEQLYSVIASLKQQQYYKVLDLHDNLRSIKVRKSLGQETIVFDKKKLANFLWTKFNKKPKSLASVMQRFIDTTKGFCDTANTPSLSFAIPEEVRSSIKKLSLPEKYYCIAVGAGWFTKQLPSAQIQRVIDGLGSVDIVLIGGPGEESFVEKLTLNNRVINLVGQLTILQSGAVLEGARALLSGDTGLMHIAAALDVPLVAVFGSTHPDMGYAPVSRNKFSSSVIIQDAELKCRPCTKHGKSACPKGHFKCMKDLDMDQAVSALEAIQS